jgi:hypothetical protein
MTDTTPHTHDEQCQLYHVGGYPLYWCKTLLAELVAVHEPAVTEAGISAFAQFVGLGENTPGTVQLFDYSSRIDKEYAATVDLDQPLLMVFSDTDGYTTTDTWLVDGYHRIYRALSEGRTTLPVALLHRPTYKQAVVSYDEWVELRARRFRHGGNTSAR